MKTTKNKFFIVSILLIFLSNCGFKVVDKTALMNFSIKEINFTGDKRINYKLKNILKSKSKKLSSNSIILNIETKKNKSIKEKNINNEITKYELGIVAKIILINGDKTKDFVSIVNGDYTVSEQFSQTLKNESNILDLLIEKLSENINRKLMIEFNEP
jgi:hypothetical protein